MQQGPQGVQQQPKKGMPTWLIVLLILGVIALTGVGGCIVCVGVGAKAVSDGIASASASAANEKAAAKAETVKVAIKDLLADYKGNEVAADQKWKGKYVITSGFVDDVKKDIFDKPYVTLSPAKGDALVIPQIQCSPAESETAKIAALQKGQAVAIMGRVKGLLLHVQLEDCTIPEKATPAKK
jgi:hypothetical protein